MESTDREATRQSLLRDLAFLAEKATGPLDGKLTDGASDALARFYERFKLRVYAYCHRRIRSSLPKSYSLDDFVIDLFFRVVRSADKLKLANKERLDDVERQILSSFHRHATWELKDILRKSKRETDQLAAVSSHVARPAVVTPSEVSGESSDEMDRLRAAMERADERTRDVLLTSFEYTDNVSGKFVLPPDVRADLCRRCGFDSENAMVKFRSRKIEELRATLPTVA